jgi:5'-phosphate synthase pdxT subunit
MTNTISGQKTGGQELVGGLDCTVHRNFFGSQVMHVFDVASFVG